MEETIQKLSFSVQKLCTGEKRFSGVEYMQVLPWENEKGEPLDGVPRIGTVLWIVPAPFPVVSHFSPAAPLEITGKIL
jgi:hypothetical protein